MSAPLRTVVIGAGNVATRLVPALERSGVISVEGVWSRTPLHSKDMCRRLEHAVSIEKLEGLPADADFYLVSVVDDFLTKLPRLMKPNDALWVHTSGTVPASVLAPITSRYGVLYPLQTLSRGVEADLSGVPFFIEGSDKEAADTLTALARQLSDKVYPADTALRSKLHAAAVFACNFANHLWSIADDFLRREAGLDIKVLEPLMHETLRKALTVRPSEGQTGPARRGDYGVMERHKALLNPDEARLYEILSDSIINYYK